MEIMGPWSYWEKCSVTCSKTDAALLGAYIVTAVGLLLLMAAIVRGHTAEMLTLLPKLAREKYTPRCYVVAATDSHSAQKALTLEKEYLNGNPQLNEAAVSVHIIPRSREVGRPQPLI
eukprot:scaffold208142_cov32-Prasinocladus_malaysianus.AAC.1